MTPDEKRKHIATLFRSGARVEFYDGGTKAYLDQEGKTLVADALESCIKDEDDNEIPFSDQLETIGFQHDGEGNMYQYVVPANQHGPKVVVILHDNNRRDDYLYAKSLSLYWKDHTNKVSMSFGIRDDPKLGEIKALLKELRGE